EYKNIFKGDLESKTRDKIFAYVLDKDLEKDKIIQNFAIKNNLKIFQINDAIDDKNSISIESWLKSIYEAEIVITDSFHGCVFSILFNKEFYCFINEARGTDRFYSLLETFNLMDRIIDKDIIKAKIDYEKVNNILENQKKLSSQFLKDNLE
ncbi:MAG: polysaccharide pyruvyl transferase family protein, partial [Campylobacter sputorum]